MAGQLSRTSIAASIAHIGWNEAPLVRGWIVKLYRRQVTGPVIPSNHIQQSVNGTDTLSRVTHTYSKCKVPFPTFSTLQRYGSNKVLLEATHMLPTPCSTLYLKAIYWLKIFSPVSVNCLTHTECLWMLSDLHFVCTCSCHRPVSRCWTVGRTPRHSSSQAGHRVPQLHTADHPIHPHLETIKSRNKQIIKTDMEAPVCTQTTMLQWTKRINIKSSITIFQLVFSWISIKMILTRKKFHILFVR